MAEKIVAIEYMCTHCGAKFCKGYGAGRPDPGRCPRRTNNQPHRWVTNRKITKAGG